MGAMNWPAVVLAALAGFVVGGLWYGPLFGKAWMRAIGKTPEAIKANFNPAKTYGLAFLLSLVSAIMLGHMFARLDFDGHFSFRLYMMMASGVALAFVIPALWTNYLFQGAKAKLAFIDAGYWLVFYLAMGVVFYLMR